MLGNGTTAIVESKVGRPAVEKEIVDLVLRMARENPSWGYDRIQGALTNVCYEISDQSVGNILKAHGIEPALRWANYRRSHLI